MLVHADAGRRMVLGGRISLAQLGTFAILLGLAGCDSCCFGCPPPPPEIHPAIGSVEILPPIVAVVAGNPFELRVRLKDASGYVLPDDRAAGTRWASSDSHLSISSSADNTPADARVQVKASPGGVTLPPITVTARIGELAGTATVNVVASGVPNPDWVVGEHEPAQPPTIALLAGQTAAGSVSEEVSAFVHEGPLDNFTGGNGEITVFSRHRRVTNQPVPWSVNCDEIVLQTSAAAPADLTSCPQLPPVAHDPARDINIRVFVLASGNIFTSARDQDKPFAIKAFEDAWSGLKLNATIEPTDGLDDRVVVLLSNRDCTDARDDYDARKQLERAGVPSAAFGPTLVTVAYVENIENEGQDGYGPDGIACTWHASNGVIVLLSKLAYVHTALAHELGHVFGLRHADELVVSPPFDMSNLMWPAESNLTITSRGPLTLGQVFRMTLGKGTFVQHLPGAHVVDCDATPSPCPRIRKDILEP